MAAVIAATATVAESALIGEGTRVWDDAQIREGAIVGTECIIGRGAYLDREVRIGDRCKVQNAALVYAPAVVGSGVFVGPGAVLTNDLYPRAVTPDGHLKRSDQWDPMGVTIRDGASVGAGAVVLGGVTIGEWAVVAAGGVVTKDVEPFGLVAGVPARRIGWVGRSGRPLEADGEEILFDPVTGDRYRQAEGRVEPA